MDPELLTSASSGVACQPMTRDGIAVLRLPVTGEEIIPDDEAAPAPAEEEFEDMPEGKRTAVRIISAILFVLLAAMVIFGTDAITGWIKSFFQ